MRVPTGFGQYVAVDSPLHRMHAGAKLALTAAVAIALFGVGGYAGMAAVAVAVIAAVGASRVTFRVALRGVRSVSILLMFTFVAHALSWGPETTDTLLSAGSLRLTSAGVSTGAFFAARIVLLVVGTSLLTLTTAPIDLADALESIMRPLELLKFPAHDVAMMLTIALRFIPTTATEAEAVVLAQMARGARFGEGGPVKRARAYVPVLIPLFVALFRRADRLATAMEARCYRGGAGRTRMKETAMSASDWSVVAIGLGCAIGLAVLL